MYKAKLFCINCALTYVHLVLRFHGYENLGRIFK
jgi:hypothetical protein